MTNPITLLHHAETWDPALLAAVVPPVDPPPALRSKLLQRLNQYCATGLAVDARATEGVWSPTGIPGIDQRMLFTDPQTGHSTYYLRLAPGATVPRHRHATHEQCLVLEGDLHWDEFAFGPGDFVVAKAHTVHSPITTRQGAKVLIMAG